MKYRTLGKTGLKVSLLSLGCMRLPDDEDEAAALVGAAVDRGINYFETAPDYCKGTCERKTGLGVKGRRHDVLLSAKSFVKEATDGDVMRRNVEASLAALGTDYLDFYQFWGFKWEMWDHARKPGGALEAIRKLQDEGVIRHLGFTSHDTPENKIALMKTGEFESVTLIHNILHTDNEEAIAYAHNHGRSDRNGFGDAFAPHGIGIVVMCPLMGGLLAGPLQKIRDIFPPSTSSSASSELAFQFVWSNEGVTTTPSGMETLAELDENVAAVERFQPLGEADRARVLEVLNEYAAIGKKLCTGCDYCIPCPNGVWISDIFRLVNYSRLFGMSEAARKSYWKYPEKARAAACTECGECERKCPHGIPIIAQLKEAAELFGDSPPRPPSDKTGSA